ncbi:phage tail tape measure protein [Enterococcus avium]|uniref:phage tail tape measure protein n=1 Tax=Enterococcus avium TaxID=33945 RepID=UPI0035C9C4E4
MLKKRSEAEVVFKATDDGLKDTVKGITSELTKNRAEFKLEQAQLQLTGSESEKLESKLSSLQKQYDLQGQKIDATSQRLSNAKKFYGENSAEVQKLERELINQQTAQQRLANDIDKTSQSLSVAKGDTQTYTGTMRELDGEQRKLQASANLVESEYKKWQATAGQSASESEKLAKAQEYVGKQSEIAEQKISVMRQQLDATKNEFGSTSTEAMQMQAKLNDAEREFEELGNAAKNVDTTNLDDIGSKIDMGNLMEASDVISDIGDKMVELGQGAMESADSVGGAQSKIQASFGLTNQEAQKLTDVAKGIYYDGFGESLDQVTDAVVLVKRNLGDLNNQDLRNITQQAMVLDNTLGADMDETLRGVSGLMTNFGLSAQDAMDLMVAGTQNGLDKSHELGDNMAEYSQLWSQMGFSAKDTFSILDNGLDSGAYNLDKVNDFVKEFGVSLSDGRIEKNIGSFSKGTQNLFNEWKQGKATSADVFKSVIGDFKGMTNEQEKLSLASTIWSALGEDNSMKVIESLTKVNHTFDDVGGAAEKMNKDSTTPMQELNGKIAELKDSLAPIGSTIIESLTPIVEFLSKMAQGFVTLPEPVQQFILVIGGLTAAFAVLSPFISSMMAIFQVIGPLLMGTIVPAIGGVITALVPFLPIIAAVVAAVIGVIAVIKNWGAITDRLSEKWTVFKEWISGIWTGISQTASTVWNAITTVITGAWNNLVAIASPIFETIKNIITVVFMTIQSVISGIWTVITALLQTAWNFIVALASPIFQPLIAFFNALWNGIKSVVVTVWNAVSSFLSGAWNAISNVAKSIFNPIASFFSSMWNGIKNVTSTVWNGIKGTLSSIWNGIKAVSSSVFNALASFLSGIWNGIKNTASNVWNGIKSTISNVANGIKSTVSNVFNGLKSTVSNIFNGIKDAMTGPVESAKNTISGIIDQIKGFFNGILLRLPKIEMPPLPHFRLSGSFSLKPPSVPHLSVDWYKKGSVFNGPNVIGVGEAGPEAVLPLNDSVLGSIGRMIAERMPEGGNGSGQVVQNEFNIEINGNVDSEVTARRMVDDIMERITEKYSNQNSAFS